MQRIWDAGDTKYVGFSKYMTGILESSATKISKRIAVSDVLVQSTSYSISS